jgi:hypothetical protein
MKRFAIVALLVAGLAVPVCAQRGGGARGGGFSGHSAGAFRGGFAGPRSGFAAPRSYGGFVARPYGFAGRRSSSTRYPFRSFRNYSHSGFHAPYTRHSYVAGGFRGSYFSGYGVPFFYGLPDWIGLGPLGCYPDTEVYGDDDANDYGAPGCDSVPPPPSDQPTIYGGDGYENGRPPYEPGYEPPPPAPPPSQAPTNEIATTIVFKDGRPSEQIHNYALTQTMLYVLDQNNRDIPLNQIDVAATEKVNQKAGIEFQIPVATE